MDESQSHRRLIGASLVTVLVATLAVSIANSFATDSRDTVAAPHVEELAYDMFGAPYRTDGKRKNGVQIGAHPWAAHEALPSRGRANWDFYQGARFGAGWPWDGYVIPWGQIFAAQGNRTWNVRLQVREVSMMYLDSNNQWHDLAGDVTDSKMYGAFWNEYFAAQPSPGGKGVRDESGNGGGWSVPLTSMGSNPTHVTWHWFYNDDFYPRIPVPDDAIALFSAAQMRLISDGGDPAAAEFIASFGADNWPTATGGKPQGKQITAFYQPRMKLVDDDWQWFTGHTFGTWFDGSGKPIAGRIGPASILDNPPPIATADGDGSRLGGPPTSVEPRHPSAVRVGH